MPNRTDVDPYYYLPPVHDHFQGSAHCVQCGGDCKLTGSDLAYTALVRLLFEAESYGATVPYMAVRHLQDIGVDVAGMRRRARETYAVLETAANAIQQESGAKPPERTGQ